MKICFVTTGDIKDIATSKRAFGMATPLIGLGWEVDILIEDTVENRKRASLECSKQVSVHYFTKNNPFGEIKEKNRLISQIKPDVVYVCAFVIRNIVKGYGAFKVVEHSELQSKIPDLNRIKKAIAISLELFSTYYSNALLGASKYLVEYYKKLAGKRLKDDELMYFPYAYSTKLYNIIKDDELSTNFLDLKDRKNFVYLGTITNNYGAKLMLETFAQLKRNNVDARLILLGKGRHYQEAVNFVKSNQLFENILLPGYVDEEDIEKYFTIADAFISPMQDTIQDWARCPSKLYMYLPFRKPIFTCKIGEPYEVLGQKGKYFDSESASSLTLEIEKFLSEDEVFEPTLPELHTWQKRTEEFNLWIRKILK